jgi:hypothetical protein
VERRRPVALLAVLAASAVIVLLPGAVRGAVLTSAVRVGGSGYDNGAGVALASDGSTVVVGSFQSAVAFGATDLTSAGSSDVFIARLAPDGTWAWAVRAGGTNYDAANAVAVGSDGSIVVVGEFTGTATFGTTTLTSAGSRDAFIAKLSSDGVWLWAVRAGGAASDQAAAVALATDGADAGAVFVSGFFQGEAGFGGTTLDGEGSTKAFVARLAADGSWVWAVQSAGTGGDAARSVAVAPDGSAVVVAGYYEGTSEFGDAELTSLSDGGDLFVAKLAGADGTWQWARSGEAAEYAEATAVTLAPDGSILVAGGHVGELTFGTVEIAGIGRTDMFVAKLGADGTWIWAVPVGGAATDDTFALGLGAAADGSAVVVGIFTGSATFGATELESSGANDVLVARIAADGTWQWALRAGGTDGDDANAVAVAADGSSVVTGRFGGTGAFGTSSLTSAGSADVFVAGIAADGTWAGWDIPEEEEEEEAGQESEDEDDGREDEEEQDASRTAAPPARLTVACTPAVVTVGTTVRCTVSGGPPGTTILWRAAYNPTFAEAGVTLDASGSAEFSFVVPAGARGQDLTVELADWLAPLSLGVTVGPVPTSVPSGGGPVPVWPIGLLLLVGVGLVRRGMHAKG